MDKPMILGHIFTVRYEKKISGAFTSGNFEYAEPDEKIAIANMQKDVENTAKELEESGVRIGCVEIGEDNCRIVCEDGDWFTWYVDKLFVYDHGM